MPYNHVTAFGTSRGNLSDDERMQAQQGMNSQNIAAQMQALNAEIADRQAGRTFQGGQAAADRTFQGGMFDKSAGLQKDLDASATQRALGITGLQMKPSTMAAELEQAKYNDTADQRNFRHQMFQKLTANGGAGGAPGAATTPGGLDNDAMMFMAMGGNPGEYMAQKRQQMQFDRQHQDAQDAQAMDIGTKLMASENPQARALGAQIAARSKNGALAGMDPQTLAAGLQPRLSPMDAVAKNVSIGQGLDELASLAKDTSGKFDTAGGLEQIKTKMATLIKSMTDRGVPPEEASAFLKQELGKRVPKETGLRLGAFFPGISSVGQTREAIGLPN